MARGLNLEEKRCGVVDGLWKGGAPPWPLSLPLKLSILCQDEPEGTGWGRVNPRRRAHRNGGCFLEGQQKYPTHQETILKKENRKGGVPPWPLSQTKEMKVTNRHGKIYL